MGELERFEEWLGKSCTEEEKDFAITVVAKYRNSYPNGEIEAMAWAWIGSKRAHEADDEAEAE